MRQGNPEIFSFWEELTLPFVVINQYFSYICVKQAERIIHGHQWRCVFCLLSLFLDMREKVTVTAKVQVYLGEEERKQVVATGCLYRMACNEVSKCLFDSGCMNFYEVNGALYHSLRETYGLKAIGTRENSWMRDVNHRVSKALVESNPSGTLFVLEDLSGIRKATERVRVKDRYVSVSWAYYDLEQKLTYKAALAGQKVVKVDPKYTSQRCPVCGSVDKHSRDKSNHVYKCSHCGYQSNDDRIAAMNLYQLGLEYLKGTEHPMIQSPSGKPGDGGCSQSPCDVTPRPKGRKKVGAPKGACTTGQSQAH